MSFKTLLATGLISMSLFGAAAEAQAEPGHRAHAEHETCGYCQVVLVPGHYELRGQEYQTPGQWVYEDQVVNVPGRWDYVTRTVTDPGRWEVTYEHVTIPAQYQTVTRRVWVAGCSCGGRGHGGGSPGIRVKAGKVDVQIGLGRRQPRHVCSPGRWEVRTERVCVSPARTERRPTRRFVPGCTRTVQERVWIPGCTKTERVRVFKPGCTETRQVRVWIPAQQKTVCHAPARQPYTHRISTCD